MSTVKIKRRAIFLASAAAAALLLAALATPALAAAPKWRLDSLANTSAAPGGTLNYYLMVSNVGDAPADSAADLIELSGALPPGLTVESVSGNGFSCPDLVPGSQGFVCASSESILPYTGGLGTKRVAVVRAGIDPGIPDPSLLSARFTLSGGGAGTISTVDPTTFTAADPSFGIDALDVRFAAEDGTAFSQAGGHPHSFTTNVALNTTREGLGLPFDLKGDLWPVEPARDIVVELPPGLLANPGAAARCDAVDLAKSENVLVLSTCPVASQVGVVRLDFSASGIQTTLGPLPLFNMEPPSGAPARLGFNVAGTVVVLDAKLRSHSDYGVTVFSRNISQGLPLGSTDVEIWNDPSDPSHDPDRACPGQRGPWEAGTAPCPASGASKAFLRLPTNCSGPLPFTAHGASWENPGAFDLSGNPDLSDPAWDSKSILTHRAPGFPANPEDPETPWGPAQPLTGCSEVPIKAELSAQPNSIDTETPTGLGARLEVPNPGLDSPTGVASSDIKQVKVTLPKGMTVNPSQAEGLGACTPAQYESSRLEFNPDGLHGCPSDSKIGTLEVKTPLLEETIPGNVYIAQPFDNPFGTLLALYVVLEEPERGVLVRLPGRVDTDPASGQITTTFPNLPQLPFSSFDLKFREGARAPLVTPQACGSYETVAEFIGHSAPNGPPLVSKSSFQITRGIGGGPCPSGGIPPFKPGLIAGSVNNNAGSYSPFNVRLFRTDAEQQFTNFSIKLPPGVTGKLAGIPFCPDAAIAAAKDPNRSGAQELAAPSCSAASQVGRTLVGAGVGSVQTYVPGKIYLAGPYNGSALSIVSITAAKVGPFDLGTVVVRLALRVNPETAEVFVDPTGSDPLPHIIDGVPTKLRDIRAYVDRPEFTLNPTSCDPTSTASTVLGSGLDLTSPADDQPVTVTTRFQAANCAALGFKPKLGLRLIGPTHRGAHPKLRAELRMPKGNANIGRAQVTLPKTEFLANAHIRTICTRVQYAAKTCPTGSVYGYAKAWTPLLDQPLEGPVYLRASRNRLPDLVASLDGQIHIDLVGRIDSVDARIRNTFETVPDAPVDKFVLTMQGGKKGLLVNNSQLCKSKPRADVRFEGHNGKVSEYRPLVKASCGKTKKAKKGKRG